MSLKATYFFRTVGAILTVLALLPAVIYGLFHVGVWGPAAAGLVLFFLPEICRLCLLWKAGGKVLFRLGATVLAVGFCFVFLMIGLLLYKSTEARSEGKESTVVVLGCQVRGTEPSRMLTYRLQAALKYLRENEEAVCILSGGQGSDERVSEAEAMRIWLTDHGIDPARLYTEDRSTDTGENLAYSAARIRELGLSEHVAVITDGFHQYRAALYAEENGLTAYAYLTDSPYFLQQSYWVREIFGILKYLFLD